MVCAFKNNG